MSPESRTPFSLGPLARERYRKAGKLASLALVMAIGLATPAAAVGRGETARPNDDCDHRTTDHGKDKCPEPKPPTAPAGCFDIDSVVHGETKYISVVCNGRVFVLTVAETGPDTGQAVSEWLPVGGPGNVIEATLAERDAVVYVSVLTADGQVQGGTCATSGGNPGAGRPITVPCNFTTSVPRPPAS